jgi:uncharacterized membrane protein YagU involved in acid resistance
LAVFAALNFAAWAFVLDPPARFSGVVILVLSGIVLSVGLLWIARGFRLNRAWARAAGLGFFALLAAAIVAGTVVTLSDESGHEDMTMLIGAVLWLAAITWVATTLLRRRPQ